MYNLYNLYMKNIHTILQIYTVQLSCTIHVCIMDNPYVIIVQLIITLLFFSGILVRNMCDTTMTIILDWRCWTYIKV